MVNQEGYDPEFMAAVKDFLARQQAEKDAAEFEEAAHTVQDILSNDGWKAMRDEVLSYAVLWTSQPDFTSETVSREQSVKQSPQLAEQHQMVLELIDKVGYATEGIYEIVKSDKASYIPRFAGTRPTTSPLPIDKIHLQQFTPEGLKYMSTEAQALGFGETNGSFTRISIEGIASGLNDRQTRPAMEAIFLKYPNAAQTLSIDIGTEYYIFGDNIGKIVHRPAPLLNGRAFNKGLQNSATSEFTAGDEFLSRLALQTLTNKLLSL